jgi:hypothetical protein
MQVGGGLIFVVVLGLFVLLRRVERRQRARAP